VDLHPPTVVGSTINQGPAKAAWDRYKRKLYHTSGVVFGFFLFFFCSAFYGVQAVPHTTGVFGFFFCFFFACFSSSSSSGLSPLMRPMPTANRPFRHSITLVPSIFSLSFSLY
jgi:hypothetical protein